MAASCRGSAPLTGRIHLDAAQARRQFIEDAIDVLVSIGGTEDLGHLDTLVDDHLVGHINTLGHLEDANTQDGQLDRINFGYRTVEYLPQLLVDLVQMGRHAMQQFPEIATVGAIEIVFGIAAQLRFDVGQRLPGHLPGVQRLQGQAARLAPHGAARLAAGALGFCVVISHSGLQLLDDADHFDCREGGFRALVTCLGTGTLDGLLDAVDSQYAKCHRNTRLQRYRADALDAFASDIFEVGSAATDNRTQGDDGVVLLEISNLAHHQRNFKGTGNPDDSDVGFLDPVALEGVDSAVDQAFNDKAVEAADNQGIATLCSDEVAFDGTDSSHINLS